MAEKRRSELAELAGFVELVELSNVAVEPREPAAVVARQMLAAVVVRQMLAAVAQ